MIQAIVLEGLLEDRYEINQEINETSDLLATAKDSTWQIYLSSVLFIRYKERSRNAKKIKQIEGFIG